MVYASRRKLYILFDIYLHLKWFGYISYMNHIFKVEALWRRYGSDPFFFVELRRGLESKKWYVAPRRHCGCVCQWSGHLSTTLEDNVVASQDCWWWFIWRLEKLFVSSLDDGHSKIACVTVSFGSLHFGQ